ncbi:MAG: hypothetical protein WAU02_03390 [Candidatus Saccharimonadales bacterium]
MSNAAEILVIILSVVLAVFLILSIVLTVLLIKVTKQIRLVADNARTASEHVANIAGNAAKFSSPALIGKFVFDQVKKFRS